MNPTKIPGANRRLRPPKDWDEARNGPCETLELLDTGDFFQSAWVPDSQEVACIQAGAPVIITVWSSEHPPIGVGVMPKPGYVTLEQYQAAAMALRNLLFMCRTASGLVTGGDGQLIGACAIAEAVVGEIPPDARRDKGDPKAFDVEVPQGVPGPTQALLNEVADYLHGEIVSGTAGLCSVLHRKVLEALDK